MVWLELPSWDVNANKDLYPPAQEVRLPLFYNHNITSATLYAFNNTADVDTAYQLIFTSFFFYSKSFQITTMLCLNQ
jgi:hypothetical protein